MIGVLRLAGRSLDDNLLADRDVVTDHDPEDHQVVAHCQNCSLEVLLGRFGGGQGSNDQHQAKQRYPASHFPLNMTYQPFEQALVCGRNLPHRKTSKVTSITLLL